MVTSGQRFTWDETPWEWERGYGRQERAQFHVVAIDYGIKRKHSGASTPARLQVTVVPARPRETSWRSAEAFFSHGPAIRRQPRSMPCR